jgi:hypothetical protein
MALLSVSGQRVAQVINDLALDAHVDKLPQPPAAVAAVAAAASVELAPAVAARALARPRQRDPL